MVKKLRNTALFFALMLTIVALDRSCCYAEPEPSQLETWNDNSYTREEIDAAASAQIEKINKEHVSEADFAWDSSTKWDESIRLYGIRDNCIGLVYLLYTDDQRTGYIRIERYGELGIDVHYSDKEQLSFEAVDITEMFNSGGIISTKLYYFEGAGYCLKSGDATFIMLDHDGKTIDASEANARQIDYLKERYADVKTLSPATVGKIVMLLFIGITLVLLTVLRIKKALRRKR